ncbi:hypothetical protein HYALB_00003220 [Hymenoscyphus albidus]|uniref:DlpA domain-containing protein n=1 Tax=Hymenoscyphus albidus TaxID=595503 RepID=A0A9N9LYD9_9HELO|nr:hypothetical protein HYALB_00003220 [Hymenoscyphus albidus]
MTSSQITKLKEYNACDISDALLKLQVPNSGFLSDLVLRSPPPNSQDTGIIIAPASTVTFVSKSHHAAQAGDVGSESESNIPKDKHWVDLCVPGSIVVMSQPPAQKCAVLGGIMGVRMGVLGVWSQGTSTVGAGAEAKPHALQTTLDIEGTKVTPGDLVFSDPSNGVVVIPKEKVGDVLDLLPGLVGADERVKEAVEGGMDVKEAFERFR